MAKKENNKEKKNNFFKELKAELKKVTWPTFKKLVNNTLAVISIVLILTVIVFILDVCFENLNEFGVEKLKSFVTSDVEEETNLNEGSNQDEVVPEENNNPENVEQNN